MAKRTRFVQLARTLTRTSPANGGWTWICSISSLFASHATAARHVITCRNSKDSNMHSVNSFSLSLHVYVLSLLFKYLSSRIRHFLLSFAETFKRALLKTKTSRVAALSGGGIPVTLILRLHWTKLDTARHGTTRHGTAPVPCGQSAFCN